MVRSYEDRPIDPAIVERILEHALHAPSAGFSQGWGFLVLTEPDDRRRFWDASFPEVPDDFTWTGLFVAPLVIVPFSHKDAYLDRYAEADKRGTRDEGWWPAPYWDIDTGMASLLMLLTATDEGLGALFFSVLKERHQPVRDAFGVPEGFAPIGAITVGHPAPDRPSASLRRGRRPVEQVVHRGRW
jgi:nitroreductase